MMIPNNLYGWGKVISPEITCSASGRRSSNLSKLPSGYLYKGQWIKGKFRYQCVCEIYKIIGRYGKQNWTKAVLKCIVSKVKQSRNRPGVAQRVPGGLASHPGVAQRVPGGLASQIFMTFGT
jgi:hypothetical protein